MSTVLAGTDDGLHTLGGAPQLTGHAVRALAADNDTLWAVVDQAQLWRGRDGTWQQVAQASKSTLTCLVVADDQVFVGTAGAHLLRLAGDGLEPVTSFDRADGRDSWYTPWGAPPDVRSLTSDASGIYINVHVGGVVRSSDGGQTWRPTIEVDHDVHQIATVPGAAGRLVAATGASGVATSDDAGATWTFENTGLHGSYCRAVAFADGYVLVSASTGPFAKRGAIYRRPTNTRVAFERCEKGLPTWFPGNVDTFHVAGGDGAAVVAADGSLYLSYDGGALWEQEVEDLPEIRCVLVA